MIILFNLRRVAVGYSDYSALPSQEKITLILTQIEKLCETLKATEPQSMWIIAWRENGIFEKKSSALSNHDKHDLKMKILALTEKYPQLVVIGGLSSYKKFQGGSECAKKLKEISALYEHHYNFVEKKQDNDVEKHFLAHRSEVEEAIQSSDAPQNVLRNTVYVFQQGKVQKHDKILPFQETGREIRIFQPAKLKKAKNLFELIHSHTKEKFWIGAEICFEHYAGLLSLQHSDIPLIHFILSDATRFYRNHIKSEFAIHLDSRFDASFVKRNLACVSFDIAVFANDLLSKAPLTLQPLTPQLFNELSTSWCSQYR